MEKREEEWNEMKQDYQKQEMSAEQFEQMKAKIKQAKKENRTKRNHRALRNIVASAAAVAVVFTVLPNTSPTIAYAMSQVPGLSKLVDVVTFRDYQYEDDHNTADITVPEIGVNTESANDTEDATVVAQTKKSTDEINAEIQKITDEFIQEFKNEKKFNFKIIRKGGKLIWDAFLGYKQIVKKIFAKVMLSIYCGQLMFLTLFVKK